MKLISIEDQIIKITITKLLIARYLLSVNDGGETTVRRSSNHDQIFTAMKTTDEDYLLVYCRDSASDIGWIRFVYGNDSVDVINDYTTNLEPVMVKIMAMITEYEAK